MISLYAVPCGPGGLVEADLVLPFKSQTFHVGDYGHSGMPQDFDMESLLLLWEMQTGDDRPKVGPIGFWIVEGPTFAKVIKEHLNSVPDGEMDDEEKAKAVVLKCRAAFARACLSTAGAAPRAA